MSRRSQRLTAATAMAPTITAHRMRPATGSAGWTFSSSWAVSIGELCMRSPAGCGCGGGAGVTTRGVVGSVIGEVNPHLGQEAPSVSRSSRTGGRPARSERPPRRADAGEGSQISRESRPPARRSPPAPDAPSGREPCPADTLGRCRERGGGRAAGLAPGSWAAPAAS